MNSTSVLWKHFFLFIRVLSPAFLLAALLSIDSTVGFILCNFLPPAAAAAAAAAALDDIPAVAAAAAAALSTTAALSAVVVLSAALSAAVGVK